MPKNILAWAIAIIVSYIIIKMIFRLLFVGVAIAFDLIKLIVFIFPVIILAIPIYMIIKKKIFKLRRVIQ